MRLAYKLARLRAPLAPKLCAASGLYQIFRHLVLPRSSRVCRGFAMRCGVGYREYKRNERFDATSSSLSTLSFPPTFYLPSGEPVLLSYGLVLFQLAPVAGSPCFHFDFSLSLSPSGVTYAFRASGLYRAEISRKLASARFVTNAERAISKNTRYSIKRMSTESGPEMRRSGDYYYTIFPFVLLLNLRRLRFDIRLLRTERR